MGSHTRGKRVKILQVASSDLAGGAERSSRNLAEAYREIGHDSWLAVGQKRTSDPNTFKIPNDESRNAIVRAIDRIRKDHEPSIRRIRGLGRLASIVRKLAEPSRKLATAFGQEDFEFPGSRKLLDLTPTPPDIVHLHNLHGSYFDLGILPELSRRVPTILNVRDAWLMSGHCAFSLECTRWKSGCGKCPDLTLYPAVARDATSFNWQRKRAILAASRLYVATPSQWMMDRVNESIIAPAIIESRVIPNGVDTRIFFPGDRSSARRNLGMGIEDDAHVLVVAAYSLRNNVWKDYATLRAAFEILGARSWSSRLIILALGETSMTERIGSAELRFVPFQPDSARLSDYYRAADMCLHAARVESFGNVLIEARACGTPVIATAVGGIPEQVRDFRECGAKSATGVLVEPENPAAFASAVTTLLLNPDLRRTIAANGLHQVQNEFTLALQTERFLSWYREILHE